MTTLERVLAVLMLLAAPLAAQKNDWLIVPGQRVGPITAKTTRAELDTLFGKENVREQNLDVSEGPDFATVVFPADSSSGLAITFESERVSHVYICFATATGPCRWKTASGIRIGLPLRELEKLNGKSFQVSGYGFAGQGAVVSWRKGALEEDPAACGHLVVRLTPMAEIDGRSMSKEEAGDWKSLQGDKKFPSTSIPLVELNPIVSSLTMEFIGSGCGK